MNVLRNNCATINSDPTSLSKLFDEIDGNVRDGLINVRLFRAHNSQDKEFALYYLVNELCKLIRN